MATMKVIVTPLDDKKLKWKVTVSKKDNAGVYQTSSSVVEHKDVKKTVAAMVESASSE